MHWVLAIRHYGVRIGIGHWALGISRISYAQVAKLGRYDRVGLSIATVVNRLPPSDMGCIIRPLIRVMPEQLEISAIQWEC